MTRRIVLEQKEVTFLRQNIESDATATRREPSSAHIGLFRTVMFLQDSGPNGLLKLFSALPRNTGLACKETEREDERQWRRPLARNAADLEPIDAEHKRIDDLQDSRDGLLPT